MYEMIGARVYRAISPMIGTAGIDISHKSKRKCPSGEFLNQVNQL